MKTKEGKLREMPYAVSAEAFTSELFDAMDAEIRSVFKAEEMITPDEVRGNSSTLLDSVRAEK